MYGRTHLTDLHFLTGAVECYQRAVEIYTDMVRDDPTIVAHLY